MNNNYQEGYSNEAIPQKMLSLIEKKRLGQNHTTEDIIWLINNLDKIDDAQLSSWLMAVTINGMKKDELAEFTKAMAFSGHVLTLQRHAECSLDGPVKRSLNRGFVDKHSTGGVGDKTTLVIAPLLTSIGFNISKFTGRALGHTGGTVNKLETIPGFRTDIEMKKFENQIEQVGMAISAQTEEFAPADRRIYKLRNHIGAVNSLELIAASVMSKKIAAGADHIILDVKVGKGAFMKDLKSAEKLAKIMKDIGKELNLDIKILLSNMDQPLGSTVGNTAEMLEAISVLKGFKNYNSYLSHCSNSQQQTQIDEEESDFYKLCIELCKTQAKEDELKEALSNGSAYAKFKEFIRAQSNAEVQLKYEGMDIDQMIKAAHPDKYSETYYAEQEAWIKEIDAQRIGELVHSASSSAPGANLILYKKIGEKIKAGEALYTISGNDEDKTKACKEALLDAYLFSKSKTQKPKLIYKIL